MKNNLFNYFQKTPKSGPESSEEKKLTTTKTPQAQPSPEDKKAMPKIPPSTCPPRLEKPSALETPPQRPNITDIDLEDQFDLPDFLKKQNLKDSSGRRPGHPEYDPSTLYIPPGTKFTPAMEQYWAIKKLHFDKILFFKVGKFYEMFFTDAIAVQGVLDLKWMGNEQKKAHVGFPEKTLEKYAGILIEKGMKVVVVEQTQTTLKNRVKKENGSKTVGREVAEVLTKSTFSAFYMSSDFEPKYLLSAVESGAEIGIALADLSTSEITVGELDFEEFKNLLSRTRPSEFVFNQFFLMPGTLKMIEALPLPPVFSHISNSEEWNPIKIYDYFPTGVPEIFESLPQHTSIRALVGCCSYLKSTLLFDRIIPVANFQKYDQQSLMQKFMILDSEALDHLEVLEATNENKEKTPKGSLYEYINRCVTPNGKRLLKRWLTAPLMEVSLIEKRLDAVEELVVNTDIASVFSFSAKKLPDLERLLARLCSYSIKTSSKAVYFEDVASSKIREFCRFLGHIKDVERLMSEISVFEIRSQLLTSIVKPSNEGGNFPVLTPICDKLLGLVKWNNKDEPEPQEGVCETYDLVKQEIRGIEAELEEELKSEKSRFNNNPEVRFVDSKFRNELEVPLYLVERKKPAEYEETSARTGFQRYYTKKIKSLSDKLEIAEDRLKTQLKPFIIDLLSMFYQDHASWKLCIDLLSQLDCLLSLSKLTVSPSFPMTRPQFSENPSDLSITSLYHPIIANRIFRFVPNDLYFAPTQHCYVLTGPNMGGKSTVLRKVGIAVILAQIGSYVPAESMILSPVDFIFTRLGASDSLIEGKSTFYLEMEEAGKFFRRGSEKSLVIMDELGRGTSTQDGSALALATLKALTNTLHPRTLFTTHYHMILTDIREIPGVHMAHMDSILNEHSRTVSFLYKLKEGECPRSYGLNVARLAGIPESLLEAAQEKAEEVENAQKLVMVTALLRKLKIAGVVDPIPYLQEYIN